MLIKNIVMKILYVNKEYNNKYKKYVKLIVACEQYKFYMV